jgi:hypothetical protein
MKVAVSACLVLTGLLLSAQTARGQQSFNISTGSAASLSNTLGTALAKVLGEGSAVKATVVPETASTQDQPPVIGAELQFGIYSTQQMDAAVKGDTQFKGHAQPDLRIAARLLPISVALLARSKSKIARLSDLKGKRFPTGYTEQQALTLIAEALLANAELTPKDVKGVPVDDSRSAIQLFLQGKTDVTIWTHGDDSLQSIDGKAGGIRILPLGNSPEALARMESWYPNAYLFQLQPAKGAVGYSAPTWIMAYDLTLVTSTKVPDAVVHAVVKALHGARTALAKASPLFNGFNPAKMAQQYPGQLYHAGAIKFYRQAGVWTGN